MKNNGDKFSIIDEGMTVDGSVSGRGNLVVKGAVKGTLNSDGVIISEEGRIAADIKARTMTIGGSFEGRAETSGQLVILATGKCAGEIICGDLVVEAGGRLDARVICAGPAAGKK